MRKLVILVVVLLLSFGVAFAQEPGDLSIEFSYTPEHPDYTATGFKVYANGSLLCETTDITPGPPMELACNANALSPGPYDFTMSAIYSAGGESPQSAPYNFEIPMPEQDAPNILIIRWN